MNTYLFQPPNFFFFQIHPPMLYSHGFKLDVWFRFTFYVVLVMSKKHVVIKLMLSFPKQSLVLSIKKIEITRRKFNTKTK
jgi:hypothetical protein